MQKVDIWMPLYIADYLSATSRLTTEQHGAYLLLIMDYWKNGAPPDNDSVLAQITKLSPDAWSNARTMLQAFFEVQDGIWLHSRVESELKKANYNKRTNIERGIKGAQARWANKNAPSIVEASSEQCSADSTSPSPSPSNKNKNTRRKKESFSVNVNKPESVSDRIWEEFVSHRKRKDARITELVMEEITNQAALAGWSLENALKELIVRNWQTFKADWVKDKNSQPQLSKNAELVQRVGGGLTRGLIGGTNVKLLGS